MGGRDQHDPGGAAAERADVDALVVDRDGQPDGAGRPQQGVGPLAVRVLDGQGDRAGPGQGADDQVEALGDAVHHDQAAGRDVGGPDPAEVGRQLGRELGDAAGVAVAQRLVGEHVQDLADRGQPGPAGEGREVGRAHPQVVADLVLDGRAGHGRAGGRRRLLDAGDLGARALAGDHEALGGELLVGLDDHAAARPEVAGQGSAGRQPDAAGQAARPDRGPQLAGDLFGQAAGGPVEPQLELRQLVLDFDR